MESVKAKIVAFVMWYFMATSGRPGAIMLDDNGGTKVYNET
jgi:hypothetical protein